MDSIDMDSMEQTGKDALKVFLGSAKATRIPIIGDVDDYLLCAKMHQENLVSDYEEFEDSLGMKNTNKNMIADEYLTPEDLDLI